MFGIVVWCDWRLISAAVQPEVNLGGTEVTAVSLLNLVKTTQQIAVSPLTTFPPHI